MTNLSLTPTKKYFGFGDKDDHVVLDGGRVIGRIVRDPWAPEGHRWFWTITAREFLPLIYNKGYAATREAAMTEFKARWMHSD